ncbi:hypothetical protein [Candidatus Leptofilum sp.]|uniref:hypothetical protein n=1 Tax=Candidatus Leptofilum sp. TaxID=3241576 RepID=UPI003B5BDF83
MNLMNLIRQNFRQWWQPPRRLADREEERSITFLELIVVLLVLLAPVFYSFRVWVEMLGAEEIPLS